MSDAFVILSRFLDRFTDDVEGRSVVEIPTDVRQKLARFASGELTETERNELVGLLQANPQWVPLLAREVKALRPGTRAES